MSRPASMLAFDLGAGSGRAIEGRLADGRLEIAEIARFDNAMLRLGAHLHWNVFSLFERILAALKTAQERGPLDGVGLDTWGVDFALLARDGTALGLPVTYRDARTDGAVESFAAKMPLARLYARTGIQIIPINTLFQLEAMVRGASPLLPATADLLMIPDLFHYWLTGVKASEATIASTTQLINIESRRWDAAVFDTLGVPVSWMQPLVEPGTVMGPLCAEGLAETPVIAVATHDTASAVAAVPAEGEDWAFISSGTWSLVGVETREAVVSDISRAANLTNEGGVDGTFRVLKNVMGLWLWRECGRAWNLGDAAMIAAAADAPAFESLIDPDDEGFLHPTDMPEAIRAYCRRAGQRVPDTPGRVARCVLESLAIKYRLVVDDLRRASGRKIACLHVIGGGSQNELLCSMAADAADLPVVAGPVEATAMGNLLVQAMALGRISSLWDAREVVRRSVVPRRYEPDDPARWDEPRRRVASFIEEGKP